MSPREVTMTWFEQGWNQGSEEVFDRLMLPTAQFHGLDMPDGQPLIGPERFKPLFRAFKSAFPDIRFEVLQSVTEGDLIAARCRVTGTHKGDGLGTAPSEKNVEVHGMVMARVRDGKIVEGWNAFDFMSMYQQVGMLPALGEWKRA